MLVAAREFPFKSIDSLDQSCVWSAGDCGLRLCLTAPLTPHGLLQLSDPHHKIRCGRFSLFQLLGRDPEAIVAGSANSDLSAWSRFDNLAATRYENLLTVDADHLARASTRLDSAGERLCRVIDDARQRLPAGG